MEKSRTEDSPCCCGALENNPLHATTQHSGLVDIITKQQTWGITKFLFVSFEVSCFDGPLGFFFIILLAHRKNMLSVKKVHLCICVKLTDDLSITSIVSGDGKAFLNVDTAPVAAAWLPLWGLPALAGGVHDTAGVVRGAAGQTLLLPLAQHVASRHTWVPLPYNQKLSLELAHIMLSLQDLQAVSWGHLANLQELLARLQVGYVGGSVAQPDHLIEALHAQVGAGGFNKGVKLEGLDDAGHTGVSGLGDLHVDSVAAWVRVLEGPGAWCRGQGNGRGEHTEEAALFQGGAGGRGWAGGSAGGQTEEEQDEGHARAGKS